MSQVSLLNASSVHHLVTYKTKPDGRFCVHRKKIFLRIVSSNKYCLESFNG